MKTEKRMRDAVAMKLDRREINENASIADAIAVMKDVKYNCLLVKNTDGKGVGILSEHDIVNAFAAEGDNARTSCVGDFMTMDIICAQESDTLDEVIKMMATHNIRHVPILSQGGSIASFVSIMELLMIKMTA